MLTLYPPYYTLFNCIADKCPDTCCAGWEVVVDEEFKSLCLASTTTAASKALERMYTDSDGDVCLKLNNGRCPMLNDNNLCEVYIDMGKEALCNTCKIYPRFFKETEEYTIAGISVSCPEAARIILNDDSKKAVADLEFLKDSDDKVFFETYNLLTEIVENGKFFNCNFEKLEAVSDELIFNKDEFKPNMIIDCFDGSNSEYSFDFVKSAAETMENFEYLSDDLPHLLSKIKACVTKADEKKEYCKKNGGMFAHRTNLKETKNLVIYYLYKYLWEAIEENSFELWIKRAYAMARLVCELCSFECSDHDSINRQIRLSGLVSKEIEHNSNNLDLFDEFCSLNP